MSKVIRIGTRLKCYDFNGNKTCFMIGDVVEIREEFYICNTVSQTFSGKVCDKFNPTFSLLKQGLSFADDDSDPRIVVVGVEDHIKPQSAPVKIMITKGIGGFKFPYGHIDVENVKFLKDFLGEEFTAVRESMNYYHLKNGYVVHIYNASVLS